MRPLRRAAVLAAVLAAACLFCAQALAAGLTLTVLPGVAYPTKEFVLTSPTPLSVPFSQIGVTENGQPVHVGSVRPAAAVGQSHFASVLLIDTSGSMAGAPLQSALSAAQAFVTSRNPKQPVGIIFFSSTPVVAASLTTDGPTLSAALSKTPSLGSGTHIFDVSAQALTIMRNAGITAGTLVVISDGADSGSKLTERSVSDAALAQGVRVYTVGVKDPSFNGTTLQSFAASAGGSYEQAGSTGLVSLLTQLGQQVSNQYLIKYQSIAPLGALASVTATVPGSGSVTAQYIAPSAPQLPATIAPPAQSTSFYASSTGAVLISVIGAILIGLAVAAVLHRREAVGARVGEFVSPVAPTERQKQQTLVERALGDRSGQRAEGERTQAIFEELEIAKVTLPLPQLIIFTLLGSALVAWILVISTKSGLAAVMALVVPFAVIVTIRIMADRQRRAFEEQLPDNLQVVASAMRAGQTFIGALGVVVGDAPEPSRRELRRALTDEQLGFPLGEALANVARRMRSLDFEHVAFVATLQRETGGNTAEIVDLVTETIRDRLELKRMVRALTAQGRLAGAMLSVLPVAILAFLSIIAPNYVHPLFHTQTGEIALGVAGAMVVLGGMIISKIVNVEV